MMTQTPTRLKSLWCTTAKEHWGTMLSWGLAWLQLFVFLLVDLCNSLCVFRHASPTSTQPATQTTTVIFNARFGSDMPQQVVLSCVPNATQAPKEPPRLDVWPPQHVLLATLSVWVATLLVQMARYWLDQLAQNHHQYLAARHISPFLLISTCTTQCSSTTHASTMFPSECFKLELHQTWLSLCSMIFNV